MIIANIIFTTEDSRPALLTVLRAKNNTDSQSNLNCPKNIAVWDNFFLDIDCHKVLRQTASAVPLFLSKWDESVKEHCYSWSSKSSDGDALFCGLTA